MTIRSNLRQTLSRSLPTRMSLAGRIPECFPAGFTKQYRIQNGTGLYDFFQFLRTSVVECSYATTSHATMGLFRLPLRSRKDDVQAQSPSKAKSSSAQTTPRKRHSLPARLDRDANTDSDNDRETANASQLRRDVVKNSETATPGSTAPAVQKPPEMRKRRVVIPLCIIDNPFLTETEFLVDARYKRLREVGTGRFGVVVYVFQPHFNRYTSNSLQCCPP